MNKHKKCCIRYKTDKPGWNVYQFCEWSIFATVSCHERMFYKWHQVTQHLIFGFFKSFFPYSLHTTRDSCRKIFCLPLNGIVHISTYTHHIFSCWLLFAGVDEKGDLIFPLIPFCQRFSVVLYPSFLFLFQPSSWCHFIFWFSLIQLNLSRNVI